MRIIPVDFDRSRFFSETAPDYVRTMLALPWINAIGAVEENGDLAEAVGLLMYDIDEGGGEIFVRWLYVLDRYRFRGIGEYLLAELCKMVGAMGFEGISVAFYRDDILGEEYTRRFESYFTEKGIIDKWKLPKNYVAGAEEFSDLPIIAKAEEASLDGVVALKNISVAETNLFLKAKGIKGINAGFFEKNVSCGVYRDGRLKGLVLVLMGGNYYMFVKLIAEEDRDEEKLRMFSALAIADRIKMNEYVSMFSFNKKDAAILSKIFEGQEGIEFYALEADISKVLEELSSEEE